jgi:hypothetical protein
VSRPLNVWQSIWRRGNQEQCVGACSPVICVKPDETSRGVTVGDRMSFICIW